MIYKWSVLAQVQDRADHIIAYQRLMSPSGALSLRSRKRNIALLASAAYFSGEKARGV
jgi:hypothetical protein